MTLKQSMRKEFEQFIRDNWDERETLDVTSWWLSKLEQILQTVVEREKEKTADIGIIAASSFSTKASYYVEGHCAGKQDTINHLEEIIKEL